METLKQLPHNYLVLFAMFNAVGNLPILADLTGNLDKQQRNRMFRKAVAVAGGIVLAFAFFGDIMLRNIFDISTSAFKIAGGILVFAVAAKGVLSGPSANQIQSVSSHNIAVFPMVFPYLAGPGTILITTILLIQINGNLLTALTVILVYLSILPILYLSPWVEKAIGKLGVMVIARILYIFICAKAVSLVLSGLHINL